MIISKKFFYLKNTAELWSNGAISKGNLTLVDLNSVYWLFGQVIKTVWSLQICMREVLMFCKSSL